MGYWKKVIKFSLNINLYFFLNLINLYANNFAFIKTNFHEIDFYKYAAVLPITSDSKGDKWVYFTLDIHNKKTVLDIFGGIIEDKDKTVFNAAMREFHEESLDVFFQNSIKKIDFNNLGFVDYKAFRTKLFIIYLKNNKLQNYKSCDNFIKKYYKRRFGNTKNYNHLTLAQAETVGMRKVKLSDLIEYIKSPNKYPDGISSYYSNYKNCFIEDKNKFRFETKILLSFASLINQLIDINKQSL